MSDVRQAAEESSTRRFAHRVLRVLLPIAEPGR